MQLHEGEAYFRGSRARPMANASTSYRTRTNNTHTSTIKKHYSISAGATAAAASCTTMHGSFILFEPVKPPGTTYNTACTFFKCENPQYLTHSCVADVSLKKRTLWIF